MATVLIFGMQQAPAAFAGRPRSFGPASETTASGHAQNSVERPCPSGPGTYIIAAVGDQPNATAAATRLMKNQEDIGAAVSTYYGKSAGDKLTALLKDTSPLRSTSSSSAKAGDKTSQQQADMKWHQNGEAIAELSKQGESELAARHISSDDEHASVHDRPMRSSLA
jgi:hypothetical protein